MSRPRTPPRPSAQSPGVLVATPLLDKHRRAARTLRGATGLLVLDLNGHRDNMAAQAG